MASNDEYIEESIAVPSKDMVTWKEHRSSPPQAPVEITQLIDETSCHIARP